MSASTFPSAFHLEPRSLRGPVPVEFERFYRAQLRFQTGSRLRAAEVAARYHRWAVEASAPAMTPRQIKRAMSSIGHAHFHSNGAHFGDVQLAADAPHLADNFPGGLDRSARHSIADQIEAAITGLTRLRADVLSQ